jgi:hypothetical protein
MIMLNLVTHPGTETEQNLKPFPETETILVRSAEKGTEIDILTKIADPLSETAETKAITETTLDLDFRPEEEKILVPQTDLRTKEITLDTGISPETEVALGTQTDPGRDRKIPDLGIPPEAETILASMTDLVTEEIFLETETLEIFLTTDLSPLEETAIATSPETDQTTS